MPSGVGLKDAHGSRRRTCCKSAGFHLGAGPLCRPLQTAVRFLQLPLPTAPSPLLALGLPVSCELGDTLGLPRFPRCPVSRQTDGMGLGTHYPPNAHGERAEVNDPQLPNIVPFGRSSLGEEETSVSCLLLMTVQA